MFILRLLKQTRFLGFINSCKTYLKNSVLHQMLLFLNFLRPLVENRLSFKLATLSTNAQSICCIQLIKV